MNDSDVTLCDTCSFGFTLNTITNLCLDCQDGSIPGCSQCADDGTVTGHNYNCTECDTDLALFDSQTCILEIEGCAEYDPNDPSICLACQSGYNFAGDRQTCTLCSTLTEDSNCDTCSVTPVVLRYAVTCETCLGENILSPDGVCLPPSICITED